MNNRIYNDLDDFEALHSDLLDPEFDQIDSELTEWSSHHWQHEQDWR